MDILKNKRYNSFTYTCRYTGVPFYYNSLDDKDVFGIGSNVYKDTPWVLHKVQITDTLDSLALHYYNNPTYWWMIAYFNDIQDAFIKLSDKYKTLKIPSFNSLTFGLER